MRKGKEKGEREKGKGEKEREKGKEKGEGNEKGKGERRKGKWGKEKGERDRRTGKEKGKWDSERRRVQCQFFPVNRVIYSSLCAFMPPKLNCAIYSAWFVYVCVCVRTYDLGSIAQFRQVFPGEWCYLQLAVCIFASQSELRHLQCTVSVCVCLHLILGQMLISVSFSVNHVIYSSLFVFMSPKVNCAIYCAQLVYECACIWSRVNSLISVSFSR